ncbi:MAG: AmmeMemoRadiSam system protein B, partial [Candidatus Cloacimonetes bacterium]|nr:AmmeMemoRadiSam system protein B [Candidatus Cloacimonadota bacterium]
MIRKILMGFSIFFIVILLSQNLQSQVREPYLAGTWYPQEKEKLEELLNNQFESVKLSEKEKNLVPFALISPHAGLELSGGVAAHGYSLLSNGDYDCVILIGSSH